MSAHFPHTGRSALRATALIVALVRAVPSGAQQVTYPPTPRGSTVDVYFGTRVADPYRWLEDPASPQTRAWIAAQNAFTSAYLAQLPVRDTLRARLTHLYEHPRVSLPEATPTGRIFYQRNSGLQNQAPLYVRGGLAGAPAVVLDPNEISPDGSVAVQEWAPSPDGRYVAYALAQGGADWRTVFVRDLTTIRDVADTVRWTRFSGISWTHDGRGFFYSRYAEPPPGSALTAPLTNQAVYYHHLGTAQAQDQLVFARAELGRYVVGCSVTEDGRYLLCEAHRGADTRNRLYLADLRDPMHPAVTATIAPVVDQDVAQFAPIGNIGSTLYLLTDDGSPRRRIVSLDLRTPDRAHLRTVVPESPFAIARAAVAGGRLVAQYLEDVKSIVRLFDVTGRPLGAIPLPGIGTVRGISARSDSPRLFYSYTAPLTPATVYVFDVATREQHAFEAPRLTFDPSAYETREVVATSRDGTRIPLFVTMRRGLPLDGTHPTMLSGYGGFDISETPEFSPLIPAWVERGGIYVTASVRGGAEYGEAWHRAGMREHKQHGFDDFIGAAEWLVRARYTSAPHLAVRGGSSGGLLVGAVINQRPDLFGVALPAGGVMDMLRYDRFTGGAGWVSEYGSASDTAMFPVLFRYSPLHNIRPGTCYPATLATAADHDDRAASGHTFKYIAALQAAQGCAKPVLVRVETQGSHGYLPTTREIVALADELAFAWANLR